MGGRVLLRPWIGRARCLLVSSVYVSRELYVHVFSARNACSFTNIVGWGGSYTVSIGVATEMKLRGFGLNNISGHTICVRLFKR